MAIHLLAEQTVGPLNETQLDLVGAAREECERLQGIVDDLLDLARIRSGRLELHPREISTELMLQQARQSIREGSDQRHVPVDLEVEPGAEVVMADPDRIDLALSNLLTNAIRHGPPGRPVQLRARRVDGGVRIEVQDDGPGIAAEYQPRLFEKFYRVPGSAPGGAGLGLSIVRDVVEAHGGKVGVQSTPGAGATFWIELPDQQATVGGAKATA
jgi:signal transduction histidine kinase